MFTLSNLEIFFEIVQRSSATAERMSQRHRKPLPSGGHVIRYDPKRRSFKNALIAIAFAGIYLEALLYIEGCRRLGKATCKKIWKRPRCTYEKKLRILGVRDEKLLEACKRFRQSRNNLIHEKSVELGQKSPRFRMAQEEATHAFAFIKQVLQHLSVWP
jgi:hypothetical protein